MAAFEYTALNADGGTLRGVIEAESERQARKLLREQRLAPLSVAASRTKSSNTTALRLRTVRMSGEELALFTRLLGTLLGSGLPLDDALSALARQADTKATQRVALGIRARILEGQSLAFGMDEFPQVFSSDYRATVGAGERTRHLPLVLRRLASFVESRDRMHKRVRLALVYPLILTLTAIAVVAGLLTYVVPEVVKVFTDMNHALPALTRGLIAVSAFARTRGFYVLAGVIVGILGCRILLRRPQLLFYFQRGLLKLPVVGRLILAGSLARFARMLAIMLSSSVDMLDALAIAIKGTSILPIQHDLTRAMEEVREGNALSRALGKSAYVPALVPHLIANGEASGNLVEMLDTAAEAYEFKVENTLGLLLSIIEPLLILVMGGIVLAIVIAILLPIFEMNQLV